MDSLNPIESHKPAPKAKPPKEPIVEVNAPTLESEEMSHHKEHKSEIKFEGTSNAAAIEKYLNSLASGFSTGALTLTAGERKVSFEPRGEVEFELKAKRKEEECSISLKLSWIEAAPVEAEPVESLVIEARKGY